MATAMDKLLAAVQKTKKSGYDNSNEKYFYYPQRDQAGNGSAVLRFLPGKTEDDIPFVKIYSHGFKGPTGKWFIENCPTTIDKECPVCSYHSELWNTNIKANQDTVRERKRNVSYISNVLVVEDKKNPENEGKVFLFRFGQKIFDKIESVLMPTFAEEDDKEEFIQKYGAEAVNIFDLKEGCNFKFKIRKVDGNTNYDKSDFDSPSNISVDVDLDSIEDLQQFLKEDQFKSNEKLMDRYNSVVGNVDRVKPSEEKELDDLVDQPKKENKPVEKLPEKTQKQTAEVKEVSESSEEDDIQNLLKSLEMDS